MRITMKKTTFLFITIFFIYLIPDDVMAMEKHDLETPWGPPLVIEEFVKNLQPHQVYRVPANPSAGFNYPYFFSVPKDLKPYQPILVNPNNDGQIGVSGKQREYFSSIINEEMSYAFGRKLGVVAFTPSFPRPIIDSKEGNLYIHALTRETMTTQNSNWHRIDLQLLAMLADLQSKLSSIQIQTADKFLMYGFSAAGDFVTRFTAIHPLRVEAVVAGGLGGLPILPISKIEGKLLTYPVGVGDFRSIFKKAFNEKAYAQVPMLFVQGSIDENDSVPEGEKSLDKITYQSDSYSYMQSRWINEYFGLLPMNRLPLVGSIYRNIGVIDFAYAVLSKEKHSDKKIKPKAANFFQCIIENKQPCAEKVKVIIENFRPI
jgi:hypothetical protein